MGKLRQASVGELGQTLAVWLDFFIRVAQHRAGYHHQFTVVHVLQCVKTLALHAAPVSHIGQLGPHIAILHLPLWLGCHLRAKISFMGQQPGKKRRIDQRFTPSFERLQAIFNTEQVVIGMAQLLRAALVVFREPAAFLRQGHQALWQVVVTLVFKLRHRHAAAGATRVARYKSQLTLRGAGFAERQVIAGCQRFSIHTIKTQKRHIQVVARKIKVVRVTAKKSNRVFRGKHQTDVLHAAVFVEFVLATPKQRHHITAHVIACGAAFLNGCNFGFLHFIETLGGYACCGSLHRLRHIRDGRQLIDFHARAARLIAHLAGNKPIAVEIFFAQARQALDARPGAVVVRHHQAGR